jgi:adenylate kinase family enzyme
VRHRLTTYAAFAAPVIEHYRAWPAFGSVDGTRHADTVMAAITNHIETCLKHSAEKQRS